VENGSGSRPSSTKSSPKVARSARKRGGRADNRRSNQKTVFPLPIRSVSPSPSDQIFTNYNYKSKSEAARLETENSRLRKKIKELKVCSNPALGIKTTMQGTAPDIK